MKFPMSPLETGLPHRPPFLFLDEILSIEPGVSATAKKTFSSSDPVFEGHFPGRPIIPGVLLAEAIAQLAGIAISADDPDRKWLLSAIHRMKFPSAATPGEELLLSASVEGMMGTMMQASGNASVGERTVAEGSVVLSMAS